MPASRVCIAALLLACSQALVADEEVPDMEFLEYLGSWEGSEQDWPMFAAQPGTRNETDERIDPAPEGEESTEMNDEQ
ncbi:MAG: hypothetical protein OEW64_09735 [Gammaproteobacteria bacterium]|nr:hypothetical protein [Gammaproteobacteria bacterium]MDH5304364.1 hypothetical protein [Gammaproteobacteria bacterium]MDH5322997.1 hypothetical protein [Gammaproteobacteria bacterium]